jgi:hypothetical protein
VGRCRQNGDQLRRFTINFADYGRVVISPWVLSSVSALCWVEFGVGVGACR